MKRKSIVRIMVLIAAAGMLLPMAVIPSAADDTPVTPGYFADFSDAAAVAENYYLFNVDLAPDDGAMKVNFIDNTERGVCFDPYFYFPLDKGAVDCEEYPYFAMVFKTDKWDKQLQIRFRTSTNKGDDYPTHYANIEKTDEYQLLVFKLTDPKGLSFSSQTNYTGTYSDFRIDCFENECPVDTEYYIKGYGLYKTEEDALTFAEFLENYEKEKQEKEKVDYGMFWRGNEFSDPALPMRMRWLSYGFNSTGYKNDVNKFLLQGYGGIVSNVNFNSQYLRDVEEFKLLADVYSLADENGMKVWIYDEYQWPSGKAFGLVLDGHDEYQATGIQMFSVTGNGKVSYTLPDGYIKIMTAELTDAGGKRTPEFTDKTVSADADGDWTLDIYALRYTYEGVEDRTKFATLRNVDLLNPDAVKRFIDLTYVKYRDEMGDAFKLVEGFFTDEPQLGNRGFVNYAVWTEKLPEKFREKYGYDLDIKNIYTGDTVEARVQRQNYYELVADMFTEAYTKQIADWCEANGTAGSGHLLFEENMNDHVETYGGGFLKVAGAMTIPGSDSLWTVPDDLLNPSVYIGNYMTFKYVGSAAKNNGKKNVMVEFNPACSDNETFSKDVVYYSYGGAAMMRMFGANIFNVINPVNSYKTEQINAVNQYVGRMNTLLDGSVSATDLAVYYPIETIQAYHDANTVHSGEGGRGQSKSEKLNLKYENMCLALLQAKADFTIVDAESILSSKITSDGCMLIGDGAYKTLVLGFAEYMDPAVLEKLVIYTKAGGRVIFVGDTPAFSTVRGQDEKISAAMELLSGCAKYTSGTATTAKEISDTVAHKLKLGSVSEKKFANFWVTDYETEDKDIVFAVNLTKSAAKTEIDFTDGESSDYSVYYPASGKIEKYTVKTEIEIPSYQCAFIVRDADNTHTYTDYAETEETTPAETDTEPYETTVTETAAESSADTGTDIQDATAAQTDNSGSGCGSFIAGGAILTVAVAALVIRKRKED